MKVCDVIVTIVLSLLIAGIIILSIFLSVPGYNSGQNYSIPEGDNFMWRHMPSFASGGFSVPLTVERGKTIDFFLANEERNACPMYIVLAKTNKIVHTIKECSRVRVNHPSASCNRTLGCHSWNRSLSFVTPENWESELYRLHFGWNSHTVYFVVTHRDPLPNGEKPILIPLPLATGGLGYNEYCGGSYYAFASEKHGTTRNMAESIKLPKETQELLLIANFRRPVVQSDTPYNPGDVLNKNSKIITTPIQWTFPTLSNEISKRAIYVAESDIGLLGESFLYHFSTIMILSKHEYIPIDSIEALEQWVHKGGHMYLNGFEFSWFTLQHVSNIPGGVIRSIDVFKGDKGNRAFSAYNWHIALKYYRKQNGSHLTDWSGTRHVFSSNSSDYLETVLANHYLSQCISSMRVTPYFSTFAELSYDKNVGRWCFTNTSSDLLGVQVKCDNVRILQVGPPQLEDGPPSVKNVLGRRWRGVIRHGKGTVFQGGGGYESPECEVAWLKRYDSGKDMLG